jgi:hypothetical protein
MIKTKKYELPVNYDELKPHQRRAVRKQYMLEQKLLCQYCGMPLNEEPVNYVNAADIFWDIFPPNFRESPIHLHHSHDSGMTIGAVHMRCNAYLWIYKRE